MARKGWHNESARHSLAARGCSTRPQKHASRSPATTPTEDDIVHRRIVDELYSKWDAFQGEVYEPSELYQAYQVVFDAAHAGKLDISNDQITFLVTEHEKARKKLKEVTTKYLNEYEYLLDATENIKDDARRRKLVEDIHKESEKVNTFRKRHDIKERDVMYSSNRAEQEAEAAAERAMDYEYERSHEMREDYPDRNW